MQRVVLFFWLSWIDGGSMRKIEDSGSMNVLLREYAACGSKRLQPAVLRTHGLLLVPHTVEEKCRCRVTHCASESSLTQAAGGWAGGLAGGRLLGRTKDEVISLARLFLPQSLTVTCHVWLGH